jgi:hypothetical protein
MIIPRDPETDNLFLIFLALTFMALSRWNTTDQFNRRAVIWDALTMPEP